MQEFESGKDKQVRPLVVPVLLLADAFEDLVRELEAELAHSFASIAPHVVGKEYMVLGTVDKKFWSEEMKGKGTQLDEGLAHTADFKKTYDLKVEGGWVLPDRDTKRGS